MQMMDRLIRAIARTGNPTVAGLDPHPGIIPPRLRERAYAAHGPTPEGFAAAMLAFNKGLIDALADIVPAVKPQAAYYEMAGWQGMRALADTIAYARSKGMLVITDGKRGDIGATVEAYAAAHLGRTDLGDGSFAAFGADALTVNGYLGTDGIAPLLAVCKACETGIFVLVKTSNPSSGELQDRMADGIPVYRVMGEMCARWGAELPGECGYSAVGAVVGATYPAQLAEMRAALPHTFFLIPGYGAQGGGAADAAPGFDRNGQGAIVNASRSLIGAWKKENNPDDWAGAARREALRMRDDLAAHIGGRGAAP